MVGSGLTCILTVVAIDIGATRIKAGLHRDKNSLEPDIVEQTPDTTSELVTRLTSIISDLLATAEREERSTEAISIGLPGIVDSSGKLVASLYTPFAEVILQAELSDYFDVPITVINDANAQAIGASNGDSIGYIALGTGVGGAVVEQGTLITGSNGYAGEIGHIPVLESTIDCECGKKGCPDTMAAGAALNEKLGDGWWERELSSGEKSVLRTAGKAIGRAATVMASLHDPERVVVAGHLTTHDTFMLGVEDEWVHPWSDCCIKTFQDTWRFACKGLTQIAQQNNSQP